MANPYFFVPVLLLAFFMQDGEPVRCWICSSDLNPFCNDPFLPYNSQNYHTFHLENCDAKSGAIYPYLTSSKSVCIKKKTYINGQAVTTRGCTWKRHDDNSSSCLTSINGPNVEMTFCETCDYDGCNGV